MKIIPGDDLSDGDIRKMLQELITAKLVREFEAENERFWQVITFEKH